MRCPPLDFTIQFLPIGATYAIMYAVMIRSCSTCFFLIIALLWAFDAYAETPDSLTLEDCIEWAMAESAPVIHARIEQWIARERVHEVDGVFDTMLRARGQYEDASLPTGGNPFLDSSRSTVIESGISRMLDSGTILEAGADVNRFRFPPSNGAFPFPADRHTSVVRVSLTQPLWRNAWGALNRAQRESAAGLLTAAEHRYDDARQAVAGLVHSLFWDAYVADQSHQANVRALEWARQLLEVNRARWRDKLMDETDVLAAEAALATREVDVLAGRVAVTDTREHLFALIGLPREQWDETPLRFPDPPADFEPAETDPPEKAFERAVSTRPDLKALNWQIRAADHDETAARQAARPSLAVGASYGIGDSGETFDDAAGISESVWSIGLQFEVPLQRRAERSRLQQVRWRQEQLERDRAEHMRVVAREIREAARAVDTAAEEVSATRRALDLHKRKRYLEQEKLEQGRSATETVIRYQEDVELAEHASIAAWARYEKARAALLLAQGLLVSPIGEQP